MDPVIGLDRATEPLKFLLSLLELEEVTLLVSELVKLGVDFLSQELLDLIHLLLLLVHGANGFFALVFEHGRARSFFDQAQDLGRLHVEHLGDLALHDEEVGVVDVELHGLEKVLDLLLGGFVTADEVLGRLVHGNDASDGDAVPLLEADRCLGLVGIVEDDGDTGTRHTRLAAFIDQILQVGSADLAKKSSRCQSGRVYVLQGRERGSQDQALQQSCW